MSNVPNLRSKNNFWLQAKSFRDMNPIIVFVASYTAVFLYIPSLF